MLAIELFHFFTLILYCCNYILFIKKQNVPLLSFHGKKTGNLFPFQKIITYNKF